MEFYWALKGKKIQAYAKTWMNSEDIMLNDISYLPKGNIVRLNSYEVTSSQIYKDRRNDGTAWGWGRREWRVLI